MAEQIQNAMANYDDYQLDEMENAAVDKSKNLKRGLVAGAAVLGVGATAAYGANTLLNSEDAESDEITSEDLLAGAQAGAEETVATVENNTTTNEVHVNHHVVSHPETVEQIHEPQVDIEESAILFDEDGEIISTYDAGTVDGKAFVAIDSDLNGKADVLAYDANNNGVFEDNEITSLDNKSYDMGQGKNLAMYVKDDDGNMVKIYDEPNLADNNIDGIHHQDSIDDIHNDFEDEKTGETYHDDYAENNHDYNNHGAEQYSASADGYVEDKTYGETFDQNEEFLADGMPDPSYQEPAYAETDSYGEQIDYGYTEPADDIASNDFTDGMDAGTDVYDA